jgi:nucleotide-binding universal stress UspA family protein
MYKKILVPLDGSELAERALPHAVEVARGSHAMLTLVRCVQEEDPIMLQVALTNGPCHHEEIKERGQKRAQEYLDEVVARNELGDLVEQTTTIYGNAVDKILGIARKDHHDLIVVSTHGRSGLNRFMLGSVTEKVMRQAPCPVMVVH